MAKVNDALYRAYLLEEELRLVIRLKGEEGIALLGHWLAWASRCRIPAFVELARKIRRHRTAIEAAVRSGTLERPGGVDQHENQGVDQGGVRVPLPRGPHRHGHAGRGRVLPRAARTPVPVASGGRRRVGAMVLVGHSGLQRQGGWRHNKGPARVRRGRFAPGCWPCIGGARWAASGR